MFEQFFTSFRLPLELVYTCVVVLCAIAIVFLTKEAHQLTNHSGIGMFRYAFLLFSLAFVIRFTLLFWLFDNGISYASIAGYQFMLLFVMEFLFIMGGILFVISITCRTKYPVLHRMAYLVAGLIALTGAMIDVVGIPLLAMYIILFITFLIGFISHIYGAVKTKGRAKRFHYLHAGALGFALSAWVINGLTQPFIIEHPALLIIIYTATSSFFILVLIGIRYALCSKNVINQLRT